MPPSHTEIIEPRATRDGRAGNWELYQKPRPFHRPHRILVATAWHLVSWLGSAGTIFCGIQYFRTQDKIWLQHALLCVVSYAVSRVGRYTSSLRASCPLCHGPQLHERSCRKHKLANKLPLLNHKTSTALNIVTRGRWNCMYCGTPFRLRK